MMCKRDRERDYACVCLCFFVYVCLFSPFGACAKWMCPYGALFFSFEFSFLVEFSSLFCLIFFAV